MRHATGPMLSGFRPISATSPMSGICFILGHLQERGGRFMRPVSEIIRDRQRAIRRELDRRQIPLKVLAYDSGIKYDTLISYFPGGEGRHPAELPSSAV